MRGAPIHINEQYVACGLMQALPLPRGTSTTPHHQRNNTIILTQHHDTNPTIPLNNIYDIQTRPAKRLTQPSNDKPLATQNKISHVTTPPSYNKSHKQGLILYRRQIKARISKTKRRATRRKKTHRVTKQHPLLDYWPGISPQSPPLALHPNNPTKITRSHNIQSLGWKPVSSTPTIAAISTSTNTHTATIKQITQPRTSTTNPLIAQTTALNKEENHQTNHNLLLLIPLLQ